MSYELLTSVVIYAGFVDANCLIYLWPEEFDSCRICVISGSFSKPIFSCFLSEVQYDMVLLMWCGVWCDVMCHVIIWCAVVVFCSIFFWKVLLLYFPNHLPSFECLTVLYSLAFPATRELQLFYHNLKYLPIWFSYFIIYSTGNLLSWLEAFLMLHL